MKCVIFLVFVATLYVVSADDHVDKTLKEAMETIEKIAKRTVDEQEQVARREAGIHVHGKCSSLDAGCSPFQHCCEDLVCRTSNNWYGMFGGKCINP